MQQILNHARISDPDVGRSNRSGCTNETTREIFPALFARSEPPASCPPLIGGDMGSVSDLWSSLRRNARAILHTPTVDDAASRWLEELNARRDLRAGTRDAYRVAARHLSKRFGSLALARWSKQDTESLVDEFGETPKGRRILWVIRTICQRAKVWGWDVPSDDSLALRLPGQDLREVHLTELEASMVTGRCLQLLDSMTHGSDRHGVAGIYLCLHAGARVSEIVGAERQAIRLVTRPDGKTVGAITVRASKSKNGRTRTVPLSPGAAAVVARLLGEHSSGWLLPSGRVLGKPIGRVTVGRQWRQMVEDLGLPKHYRVHDLRHTYASLAVQSGCDLYHVQEALGHTDAWMTQRYAHLRLEERVAVSEVVERKIGGAK